MSFIHNLQLTRNPRAKTIIAIGSLVRQFTSEVSS